MRYFAKYTLFDSESETRSGENEGESMPLGAAFKGYRGGFRHYSCRAVTRCSRGEFSYCLFYKLSIY